MFAMYKNSPGHWANILSPSVTALGIATVERLQNGYRYKWNTMRFANGCSTAYGDTFRIAFPMYAERHVLTRTTAFATFESGRDWRAGNTRTGTGLGVAGPTFDTPATGDQAARFTVTQTAPTASGAAGMFWRQGLALGSVR